MSEELTRKLEELKDELSEIGLSDPKLEKLANDIDEVLAQTNEPPVDLAHSLQNITEEFEVNHPKLIAIINNVMTSLSNIGI